MVSPAVVRWDLPELLARATALVPTAGRALLGVTGPPGAGKSTLAAELVSALGQRAALVPMDGFHLSNAMLRALGRRGRKGEHRTPSTPPVTPGSWRACGSLRPTSSMPPTSIASWTRPSPP